MTPTAPAPAPLTPQQRARDVIIELNDHFGMLPFAHGTWDTVRDYIAAAIAAAEQAATDAAIVRAAVACKERAEQHRKMLHSHSPVPDGSRNYSDLEDEAHDCAAAVLALKGKP